MQINIYILFAFTTSESYIFFNADIKLIFFIIVQREFNAEILNHETFFLLPLQVQESRTNFFVQYFH